METIRVRQRPQDEHEVSEAEAKHLRRLGLVVETSATTEAGALRAAASKPNPNSEGESQ